MTGQYITAPRGRAVDPGHLESLGKTAAHLAEDHGLGMTEAVISTIGNESLNVEQVRRVCESANIEAFQRKFASLRGPSRAVHIEGGPADPVSVIQGLNDAARPQEVTVDALEYSMPPELVKSSAFVETTDRTTGGVRHEVGGLRAKLAAAHDELVQSHEAAMERTREAFDYLTESVKSASAAGATPDEIYSAWYAVDPVLSKLAFERTQGLMKSNTKIAGRYISPGSKIVTAFDAFVKEAESAEAHRRALGDVEAELHKVSIWLQRHGG